MARPYRPFGWCAPAAVRATLLVNSTKAHLAKASAAKPRIRKFLQTAGLQKGDGEATP